MSLEQIRLKQQNDNCNCIVLEMIATVLGCYKLLDVGMKSETMSDTMRYLFKAFGR